MKRIDELSKAEVLALTNEEISILIDLECAYENVPLLPAEPVKPEVAKYEPDIQVYKIFDLLFKSSEEAAGMLEAFAKTTAYKMGYDDKYPKPIMPDDYYYPKIENKKVMSLEMYNRVKTEKEAADAKTKEYEALKKEYDGTVSKRQKQVKYVWDIVRDYRDEQYKKDRYKAEFDRYMKLADNNHNIAWNFLKNAHDDAEDLEGLFEELVPAIPE
jgi:hypothetical protein